MTEQAYVLSDMTWPEVEEALKTVEVTIIPTGSNEQHGPHLALRMDIAGATGMALKIAPAVVPQGHNGAAHSLRHLAPSHELPGHRLPEAGDLHGPSARCHRKPQVPRHQELLCLNPNPPREGVWLAS